MQERLKHTYLSIIQEHQRSAMPPHGSQGNPGHPHRLMGHGHQPPPPLQRTASGQVRYAYPYEPK